jgi:hypothetical protein
MFVDLRAPWLAESPRSCPISHAHSPHYVRCIEVARLKEHGGAFERIDSAVDKFGAFFEAAP